MWDSLNIIKNIINTNMILIDEEISSFILIFSYTPDMAGRPCKN